jgi:hypothetical protein
MSQDISTEWDQAIIGLPLVRDWVLYHDGTGMQIAPDDIPPVPLTDYVVWCLHLE